MEKDPNLGLLLAGRSQPPHCMIHWDATVRAWRYESWSVEGVRTSRNPIDLLRDTEESSISLRRLEMINLVCTETSSVSFDYMCCVHNHVWSKMLISLIYPPKDEPIRRQPFCLSQPAVQLAGEGSRSQDGDQRTSFLSFSHPPSLYAPLY